MTDTDQDHHVRLPQSTIAPPRESLLAMWLLLAIAFAVALAFDRPIAIWAHELGTDKFLQGSKLADILKFPGTGWFGASLIALGLIGRLITGFEALFLALATAMSAINGLVKWVVGRTRPFKLALPDQPLPFHFEPFWHGINGFFHQVDLSFPSGHACTAFATATAVWLLKPRWALPFFVIASITGAERILETAHYCSDVIAAAALGIGGTLFVHRLMRKLLQTSKAVA